MSEHTPEPWRVVAKYRIHGYMGGSGVVIGVCGDPPQRDYTDETAERWAADARRIVMCVNAMEGMGEMRRGSVKGLMEALERLTTEWKAFHYTGYVPPEDGAAASYYTDAIHNCADQIEAVLDQVLRELGEDP